MTKRIYLIESKVGTLKIGCSVDPHSRAARISATSPCPVRLIAIFAGGYPDERELHRRFAEHRSHNEWFRMEGEVIEFVASVFGSGIDRVASWSDCDRPPSRERRALVYARIAAATRARWADPVWRAHYATIVANRKRNRGAGLQS
jgi:hypothetical protein